MNKIEKTLLGTLEGEGLRKFDSIIIKNQQAEQLMTLCEFSLKQKWKLVYRAFRDSFEVGNFHSKCDSKTSTLIVIQSTSGNVFGGYTQQNWLHKGSYKLDRNAFIFSLINKENRPLLMRCHDPAHAIACYSGNEPIFGINYDSYSFAMVQI